MRQAVLAGEVATLPAFDTLPWESQSPHPDILERRAATLFRLADGQISLVVAPITAALWRYNDPYLYLSLARTLSKDSEIPHEELVGHLAAVGYTRTEMVELPGQFAVRGGIVDFFSPEAQRPVRIELLGDTVESVREFDARTQRSIAPVVRTTLLPLTEWAVPSAESFEPTREAPWETHSFFGPARQEKQTSLFELAESSLRPLVFLDEPQSLRDAAEKHLDSAKENYDRHGQANAPEVSDFFWIRRATHAGAGKDLANPSGTAGPQRRFFRTIRAFFATERALPRRCGGLHGGSEIAACRRRNGISHGREPGGIGAPC